MPAEAKHVRPLPQPQPRQTGTAPQLEAGSDEFDHMGWQVQVVKVDMERRQVDLGLVEILDAVREKPQRAPRLSKAGKAAEREVAARERKKKQRPGKKERAAKRQKKRR